MKSWFFGSQKNKNTPAVEQGQEYEKQRASIGYYSPPLSPSHHSVLEKSAKIQLMKEPGENSPLASVSPMRKHNKSWMKKPWEIAIQDAFDLSRHQLSSYNAENNSEIEPPRSSRWSSMK